MRETGKNFPRYCWKEKRGRRSKLRKLNRIYFQTFWRQWHLKADFMMTTIRFIGVWMLIPFDSKKCTKDDAVFMCYCSTTDKAPSMIIATMTKLNGMNTASTMKWNNPFPSILHWRWNLWKSSIWWSTEIDISIYVWRVNQNRRHSNIRNNIEVTTVVEWYRFRDRYLRKRKK